MAQLSREDLKAFFETGDKPTQDDFANLIDSVLNFVDDGAPSTFNVEVKTSSFTAESGKSYRVEGVGGIEIILPTTGSNISIVNAGNSDLSIGSLGTLYSGDYCILYFDTTWKEYTSVLSPTMSMSINTALGSGTNDFTLDLNSTGTYDFVINWGDGNIDEITSYNDAKLTHTYDLGGIYNIKITGELASFYFNNAGDKLKIIGLINLSFLQNFSFSEQSFWGCSNIKGNLTIPSGLTLVDYSDFRECSGFTGRLNLPSSMTELDHYAFSNCLGFTEVYSYSETAPSVGIQSLNLNGTPRPLHIPATSTGYNVAPWTTTSIFSTIINDL